MSDYVVDILTDYHRLQPFDDDDSRFDYKQYMIKIDNNGNVNVSQNVKTIYYGGCSDRLSGFSKLLEINDNIPIPVYLIPVIKQIFTDTYYKKNRYGFEERVSRNYKHLYNEHWEIAINFLKLLKQELKQTTEDPQNTLDIKNKLETYITKFNLQEEKSRELKTKMENIEKEYFKTNRENEKIKSENKMLREKITQLENMIINNKDIEYKTVPDDNSKMKMESLEYCPRSDFSEYEKIIEVEKQMSNAVVYSDILNLMFPKIHTRN
jgi:hypothetical protein